MNDLLPLVVHEETAHAGTSNRRSEIGHQALLSEEGHNEGGV